MLFVACVCVVGSVCCWYSVLFVVCVVVGSVCCLLVVCIFS